MGDKTSIQWTDAARKAPGIETLKWCTNCQAFHPRAAFKIDRSRYDGLTASCADSRNRKARERYVSKPRPPIGRRFVEARDGDRKQARRRVNYLVEAGLLLKANDVPCSDCGHVHKPGFSRHEYDHPFGYTPENHERVEVVCSHCHHKREARRGKNQN